MLIWELSLGNKGGELARFAGTLPETQQARELV
jgi:hypothetical protein